MSVYRFLEDAYIGGIYYQAGTIASTVDVGGNLPAYWVPTGNVDPVDLQALSNFTQAGPQDLGLVRTQFTNQPLTPPGTYWIPSQAGHQIKTQIQPYSYWQPDGNLINNPPELDRGENSAYIEGAIRLWQGAFVRGSAVPPPISPAYARGVMSFWARYTPGLNPSGSYGSITQIQGLGQSNNVLLVCQNIQTFIPSPMRTIAAILDPSRVSMNVVDYRGPALITASVENQIPGFVSSSVTWFNRGTLTQYYVPANVMFNGQTSTQASAWLKPCDPLFQVVIPTDSIFINDTTSADLPYNHFPNPPSRGLTWYQGKPPPGSPPGGGSWGPPATLFPGACWQSDTSFTLSPGDPGQWHHYICSFDTQQIVTDVNGNPSIRLQWAMDGGGGPVFGGPLLDTAATTMSSFSQPFSDWTTCYNTTGLFSVTASDIWIFSPPIDAFLDLAYCYFGTSNAFFDLTQAGNVEYFFKNGAAVNFGNKAQSIPLFGIWMHTGGAVSFDFNAIYGDQVGPDRKTLLGSGRTVGLVSDIDPPPSAT